MNKCFLWPIFLLCCFSLWSEEPTQIQTHRVLQFENEHVKVWKTIIMPHQPLKMHRHDCSRVIPKVIQKLVPGCVKALGVRRSQVVPY
jgi:hypothetical protein